MSLSSNNLPGIEQPKIFCQFGKSFKFSIKISLKVNSPSPWTIKSTNGKSLKKPSLLSAIGGCQPPKIIKQFGHLSFIFLAIVTFQFQFELNSYLMATDGFDIFLNIFSNELSLSLYQNHPSKL